MKKSKIISVIVIIILITNVIFQVRSLADNENETENNNTSESSNITDESKNDNTDSNETNSLNDTTNNTDTNTVGNTNVNNTDTNTNIDTNTSDNTAKVASNIVVSFFLKDGDITWSLNNDETINGYVGDEYSIERDSKTYVSLIKSGNYTLDKNNTNIMGIFTNTQIHINVYLEIAGNSGETKLGENSSDAFGKSKENMMGMTDFEMEEFTNIKGMLSQARSDLDVANSTINSLTQSTTYQGSQNNYLKTLSISGVELKNEFKKTTNTYFASVDSNTTSVKVTATPEDSSATVTVYGNTNLQAGTNKILINVTAEDGSIRTYRIYVTKQ